MTTDITIAFVHGGAFPCGGAERVTMDVTRELASYGLRSIVICQQINRSLLPPDFPVEVIELLWPNKHKRSIEEYTQILQSHKVSVVVFICFLHREMRRLQEQGWKVVLANHSMPFWESVSKNYRRARLQEGNLWQRLRWHLYYKKRCLENDIYTKRCEKKYKQFIQDVDAYTVLCEGYKHDIVQRLNLPTVLQDKIHVIGNYEKIVTDPTLEKEPVVLFVGRLTYDDKRVDRLLRIWHTVEQRDERWRLLIVGDGSERARLEHLAAQLHLRRVSFEGKTADTARYYRRAAILCMTSSYEGWGLVLTEAQAHGVVPMAFNCCAGVETILAPSGTNGILVPPFDLSAYAESLLQLMHHPDELARIREHVLKCRYPREEVCQKYVRLFKSLL